MKTVRKRSLTLNLSDEEMAMLDEIADHDGMSKSAVLRLAIRNLHAALKKGSRFFEGKESNQ
jgi:predicted transcriptional regulator